jgi:3-hydroxyisobutyrate dehydrogenase-like beta-hydroxyacid dehydrogenase
VTIGVVGLGSIGSRLARNLLGAGFGTVVYDLRADAVADLAEAGATPAEDLPALGRASDVVLLSPGTGRRPHRRGGP